MFNELKSPEDLTSVADECTELLELALVDDEYLRSVSKPIASYYRKQNDVIRGLLALEKDESWSHSRDHEEEIKHFVNQAVRVTFVLNIVLLSGKLTATLMSSSMVLFASTLDSVLDIGAAALLYYTSKRGDTRARSTEYPVGKSRMRSLGIVVFSAVMGMASIQVIRESIGELINRGDINISTLTISTFVCICFIKMCLYVYCRTLQVKIEQIAVASAVVSALYQDHLNDVFSNAISITIAILASRIDSVWFLDPLGAILISLLILWVWVNEGKEQVDNLIGRAASQEFVTQVTYLAIHHHPMVLNVDTVWAYYSGLQMIVEMHIVLPRDLPLHEAHDIGEALEVKIETHPEVERAFVHLDYEFEHKPEHNR